MLFIAFITYACAPKPTVPPIQPPVPPAPPVTPAPPVPPEPEKIDTGEELFTDSEKLLADRSYFEALEGYHQYISRFPRGPHADKALIKIGRIYIVLENYSRARDAYLRLIEQYPDSSEVTDARIEMLVTYLKEGKFQELISQASTIRDDVLSNTHLMRKYLLLGDAYLGMGSPVDAINFYSGAFKIASEPEKTNILIRFKNAVSQIDSAGIIYLLGLLPDDPPAGYLMYRLGINKFAEEQYEAAEVILKSFLDKFPEHEWVQDARQLVEQLENRFIYDRFAIGCLLPLSGRYKTYGYRALNGIKLALAEFGSKTGNPEIKIIVKDTGADPERTRRAVDALIEEKVAAIIGPLTHADIAAKEAQASELPIITLTQKDQIAEIGDFVFRNFFTPKMQVESLVSYIIKELDLKRFAILYPAENYGSTFMNLFWDEVIAHEGIVVGVESYDPRQTDFADPIKKLVGLYYEIPEELKDPIDLIAVPLLKNVESEEKKEDSTKKYEEEPKAIVDFDAIFIPDSPKAAGLIIPQLAYYDIDNVYLLGTNLWNSKDLIEMARQYVQAAIIPEGFFAGSASKTVKHFVKVFEETFNHTPGFMEAVSYDTAMILLQLTNQHEIRSRNGLKHALTHLKNYKGVTGLTSFTNSGDVHKELYILRIRGDKFIELKHN